jgi:hypothetical protein
MTKSANWLYLYGDSTYEMYIFAVSPDGEWHCIVMDDYGAHTPGGNVLLSDAWSPSRLMWYTTLGIQYIELALGPDNPLETTGYSYGRLGELTLPWFDGRFAEIAGTALRISIYGDALTLNTQEYIEVYYRTAKDADFLDLGAINSTNATLDFASGVGVAFNIIQFKFELNRRSADATKTPIIRRIVFQYLKKPPVRYRYTASIQVAGTRSGLRSMETVLGELETAYDATTLRELKYGRVTANVNIVGLNFVEKPATQKTGQRNVYQIQVAMEEPI